MKTHKLRILILHDKSCAELTALLTLTKLILPDGDREEILIELLSFDYPLRQTSILLHIK